MPYKSDAQRRFFHANEAKIGKKVVHEFDAASELPDKMPLLRKVRRKKRGV